MNFNCEASRTQSYFGLVFTIWLVNLESQILYPTLAISTSSRIALVCYNLLLTPADAFAIQTYSRRAMNGQESWYHTSHLKPPPSLVEGNRHSFVRSA